MKNRNLQNRETAQWMVARKREQDQRRARALSTTGCTAKEGAVGRGQVKRHHNVTAFEFRVIGGF